MTALRSLCVALGCLAGRPAPDTLRLLRDYLGWVRELEHGLG